MIFKHRGLDKYDAHKPGKPCFIQDTGSLSNHSEKLHNPAAYGYISHRRGFQFGINKKLWKASPSGYRVDGYNIGKSDVPS